MSNERLIKTAHICVLAVMVVVGLIIFAGSAKVIPAALSLQNANSNSSSQNRNQNNNSNSESRNSDKSNSSGDKVGMTALSSQDRSFMMEAAMGGMMEVELGRIATQQASNTEIKEFGQRMVDDHSRANAELMQLAASKGISLPTELDEKHRNEVNKMSKLTGADFDRAYAKMMLTDHNKDVAAFEKQSTRGTDVDLKSFAAKTLPTLKEHLAMAKALPGNAGTAKMKTGGGNSNRH